MLTGEQFELKTQCVCDFKDTYYGYECVKCGQFYPYGCAPWDDPGDEPNTGNWDDDPDELEDYGYDPDDCAECDSKIGQGESHDPECPHAGGHL